MKIGEKIRQIRKQKNLTSSDLAGKAGTSQSTISALEHDNRSPTIDTLLKVTRALNIRMIDILSDDIDGIGPTTFLEEEKILLNSFKRLSEKQRHLLIDFLKSLENDPQSKG